MWRIYLLLILTTLMTNHAVASISAPAWLGADGSGRVIISQNIDQVRPIASITKLMTVLVVLDRNMSLTQDIVIVRVPNISTHIPRKIKRLTRAELIGLALITSDNLASALLCANYDGLGFDPSMPCVGSMNKKAEQLSMTSTVFTDPTGLHATNVSSARDLIKLVQAAAKYSTIVTNSNKHNISISSYSSSLSNTNPLIGKYHNILVSKTGWISASGGCVVMLVVNDHGRNHIIIVLGSATTKTRIVEAELISKLIDRQDKD